MDIDLSCVDWEDRIMQGRSLIPAGLPLHEAESAEAVDFFDQLHLPDVPGKPQLKDAAGDWFRDIVRVLFGAYSSAEGGERLISEVFAMVPKGNSKSSYSAALMLVALIMNNRPNAEFLFIAPTQIQAEVAFDAAVGMINEFGEHWFKPVYHQRVIDDLRNGSSLRIKTFALDVLTGTKPAGVLLDEIHLFGKISAASKLMIQIRGGLEKVPEGFLVMITTQSDSPPTGAFEQELKAARAVRDGKFKGGRLLPILYEFPLAIAKSKTAWRDSKLWPLVNPNMGRSLRLSSLEKLYREQAEKGEASMREWASQHLNIEIGVGLGADGWSGAPFWEERADKALTLQALVNRCHTIVCGIDGGGLDDLLGFSVMGIEAGAGKWLSWSKAWVHRSVLTLRQTEAPRLQELNDAEELVIVDRMETAFDQLADIVAEINSSNKLATIGLDPVGVKEIVAAIEARNIKNVEGDPDGDRLLAISQGYKLSGTIKSAEVRLSDGNLIHADQKLMDWCVGNAKMELKGNALLITKQVSGTAKIDPLMAMLNCVALMGLNPKPRTRSFWQTSDIEAAFKDDVDVSHIFAE